MKNGLFILLSMLALNGAMGQPVNKNVLVEHFTNTYCSICASRNPGFYDNLHRFPQVLHIAYYPSAPYPACPLNQHNITDNDDRTNLYGIYGATPRIVIQGQVIPANSDYGDSLLFKNELGRTTSFDIRMSAQQTTPGSIDVRAVITRRDTSSLSTLQLYGAIVEDTLMFNAGNGETIHYNVFRKSVWTSPSMSVTAPAGIGDSVVFTQTVPVSGAWDLGSIYVMGVLQDVDNHLVQADRSANLPATLSVNEPGADRTLGLYPNPAGDLVNVSLQNDGESRVSVLDINGAILVSNIFSKKDIAVDVSKLAPGFYNIKIVQDGTVYRSKFIKR